MVGLRWDEITVEVPDVEGDLAPRYARFHARLEQAEDTAERLDVIREWDGLRRTLATWSVLTMVRFAQDSASPERLAALQEKDALWPQITELDTALQRSLLESPHRAALEAALDASHTFALWTSDIAAFSPEIAGMLEEEAAEVATYSQLVAQATFTIRGESYNLGSIGALYGVPDRALRQEAEEASWEWFEAHGEALDGCYDRLVKLRHRMAQSLGLRDHIEMGYLRMRRVGYDAADVARFRDAVRRVFLPLLAELRARQSRRLGLDSLAAWDLACHRPDGNPRPGGDSAWQAARAAEMFRDAMPMVAPLFEDMLARGLLDLDAREGKQPGGFCVPLYDHRSPFVFANFNGAMSDVEVFTHEMGHAFQFASSFDAPLIDQIIPTFELAEVHSIGLELLTRDEMARFFGEQDEAYRQIHLSRLLVGVLRWAAGDDFQHRVYARPEATPAERHAMWREVESLYQPDIDWRHLEWPAQGTSWQTIGHFFFQPFYLIDYALAACAALQLWALADEDRAAALDAYRALARCGGRRSYRDALEAAGLRVPFDEGCLEGVRDLIQEALGL